MRSRSRTTRRCSTRFHRRKRTKRMRDRTRSKRCSRSMRSRPSQPGRSTWKARRQKPAMPAGKTGRRAKRQAQGPMRRRCGVRALRPCHVLRIPRTQAAWGVIAGSAPSSPGAGAGPRGRRIVCIAQSGSGGANAREGPSPEFFTGSASPRRCTRPSFRCLLVSQTTCGMSTHKLPACNLLYTVPNFILQVDTS